MTTSGCENKYRQMARLSASMSEFVPRHISDNVTSCYQLYC
jgi:hypothetical protein